MPLKLVDEDNWPLFWQDYKGSDHRDYVTRANEIAAAVRADSSLDEIRMAVQRVNEESNIQLDAKYVEVFSLLFMGLKDVERFTTNKHISPKNRGNTASHCLSVCALGDDVFYEAFKNASHPNAMIPELRQNFHVATLMHDLGEMVAEFLTLAKQTRTVAQDHAEGERIIADFFCELAFSCVETNNPQLFIDTVAELRDRADIVNHPDIDTSEGAIAVITKYIEDFDRWPQFSDDPEKDREKRLDIKADTQELMEFYDKAEAKLGLSGPIVKSMQRTEGEQYFQRMQGKDGGIPWHDATSALILAAIERIETALPEMYERCELRSQRGWLKHVHLHIYDSAIKHIETMPEVISRTIYDYNAGVKAGKKEPLLPEERQQLDPEPGSPERSAHHTRLRKQYRAEYAQHQGEPISERILSENTITRYEALLVYRAARQAVEDGNYSPKREEMPLLAQRKLPDALKPYVDAMHAEERREIGRTLREARSR